MSSKARKIRNEKRNAKPKKERFHIFKVGDRVNWNRAKEQQYYDRYQSQLAYYGNGPFTVIEIIERDDNGPDDHPQKIRIDACQHQGRTFDEGDWFVPAV